VLALDYAAGGSPVRRISLGETDVRAGTLTFATARIWDDGVTAPGLRPTIGTNPAVGGPR
jgi:hypothetical protein